MKGVFDEYGIIRLRSELNFYESRLRELNQQIYELQKESLVQSIQDEGTKEKIIDQLLKNIEIIERKI